MLETLGVPVIGYRKDRFPAFYFRESSAGVDARFDDIDELAAFIRTELERTVAGSSSPTRSHPNTNPTPSRGPAGSRRRTSASRNPASLAGTRPPALLAALHDVSGGATLDANIELIKNNARLGAMIAVR